MRTEWLRWVESSPSTGWISGRRHQRRLHELNRRAVRTNGVDNPRSGPRAARYWLRCALCLPTVGSDPRQKRIPKRKDIDSAMAMDQQMARANRSGQV